MFMDHLGQGQVMIPGLDLEGIGWNNPDVNKLFEAFSMISTMRHLTVSYGKMQNLFEMFYGRPIATSSDFYLILTIPDILSTYGIPQIICRVNSFATQGRLQIKPAGIVISMYGEQSRTHKTIIEMLRSKGHEGKYPTIYETVIPLTKHAADAADFNTTPSALRQKYGYGGMFDAYDKLTNEFLERTK